MPITANDVKLGQVLSILSKGYNGTGKSIGSCGKLFRPVYVFDFEDRMRSVINYYKKLDGHCNDVYYDTFAMGYGFTPVDKKMDELALSCPYKTVVAATLSSYVDIVLTHLIDSKHGQKRASGQAAGKYIAGIPVNELEDFNAEDAAIIFELIKFLKMLQKQGVNIILEAHITVWEQKDEKTKEMDIKRAIVTKGKKAPPRIPGYFDEIWHFYTVSQGFGKDAEYHMTTRPTEIDFAKTSNGLRPDYNFTNKDLSVMIDDDFSDEVKNNPRADPNAPKLVSFG